MVDKPLDPNPYHNCQFESSVNSYGRQTHQSKSYAQDKFESSVNSYGRQTIISSTFVKPWFESSVNSYGRQTIRRKYQYRTCLRVV